MSNRVTNQDIEKVAGLKKQGLGGKSIANIMGIGQIKVKTIMVAGRRQGLIPPPVFKLRMPTQKIRNERILKERNELLKVKFGQIIELKLQGMRDLEVSANVDMALSDVKIVIRKAIEQGYQLEEEVKLYNLKRCFTHSKAEKRRVIAPKVIHLRDKFRAIASVRASDKAPKPERKSPKTVKVAGISGFYTTPDFWLFFQN